MTALTGGAIVLIVFGILALCCSMRHDPKGLRALAAVLTATTALVSVLIALHS
jgi:hypothetical protein